MSRNICIITGTRAEYGLLYWLIKRIELDNELNLQLVVTGMHLSPEFGLTYKQIEADGFKIDEKVEMLLSSDTPASIAKSVGLGTILFSDVYSRLNPDILIVLGDRYEIFAATQAAMLMRIPIAHIHGGELTEGAVDDSIRHAITKMAHVHFTANQEYMNRVIQMGEQPGRVYNVGALGIEGINSIKVLSKQELTKELGFSLNRFFLITLHPTTLNSNTSEKDIRVLLESLNKFPEYNIVFTKTNADAEGRIINQRIEEYVAKNNHRARLFDSLGQLKYLSALKHCEVVIGNSSSGIIEAPYYYTPTVNIGIRQNGRLRAKSVIDCSFEHVAIHRAIEKALSSDFKSEIQQMSFPYGVGHTSQDILNVLKTTELDNISIKRFHDLKV